VRPESARQINGMDAGDRGQTGQRQPVAIRKKFLE
jgi:hypothetical protein